MNTTPRSSRHPAADLDEVRRAARTLARAEGWTAAESPPGWQPPDAWPEARLLVSGRSLPTPGVLRVRERRPEPSPDVAVRRAAGSEHIVGVLRVLPSVRVKRRTWEAIVLPGGAGARLETVLERKGGLRSGEAATILLGVAAGVDALHGSGRAGPTLAPASIVFALDGCPALDGLDAVQSASAEAIVRDAEAFHALARTVCLRVTDGSGMSLLAAIEEGLRAGSWAQVESRVLAAAAPEPVRIEPGAPEGDGGDSAVEELSTAAREHRRGAALRGWRSRGRNVPALASREPPGGFIAATEEFLDGDPVRAVARAVVARVRRRPAILAVGLVPVAVALVVVALLPAAPAESASRAVSASGPSTAPVAGGQASGQPSASRTREAPEGTPAPQASASTTTTAPTAGHDGEDPVLAAAALLEARHACFGARHPTAAACLQDVLDGDVAFAAEESGALGEGGAVDARDYTGASITLLERWGSAALVAVAPDGARTPKSQPASLLLVRSEAGWRLRAVYP